MKQETYILGSLAEIIFFATANFLVCFCFPMINLDLTNKAEGKVKNLVEDGLDLADFMRHVRSQSAGFETNVEALYVRIIR